MRNTRWNENELAILREKHECAPHILLGALPGRSWNAIKKKGRTSGLQLNGSRRAYNEDEIRQIVETYSSGDVGATKLSRTLGIPKGTISKLLHRRGLSRSRDYYRLEHNPSWKGGKYIRQDGYVAVWAPNHPRQHAGGYVLEHILVWEKAHGQSLPKDYIIHHLNGNKSDNRVENLVAIKRKEHDTFSFIRALQGRIVELEAR
jgi:hypothetical protein